LRANNMFQGGTEFGGKLPVSNEDKTYHRITRRALKVRRSKSSPIMTIPRPSARAFRETVGKRHLRIPECH
jgi:hypothetical protein